MNKFLLEKYLKDQCSQSEKLQVQEWLSHPDNNEFAKEFLLKIWKNEPGKRSLAKVNYDNLWTRILLKSKIHFASKSNFRRKKVTGKKYRLAIASVLVLAIVFTGFFLFFANAKINVSTGFSESKTIELPDGTIIKLNNNSQLEYHENFGEKGLREIWLQGEAFFKVAHLDNNTRFIVNTANLEVEVLGTSFNLIDRNEKVELVLNSGKVKLNEKKRNNTLYMKPGELVAIENNQLIRKKNVNTDLHTSWRYNLLNFEQTSISEIADMIHYNFGKEVIIADQEVGALKFTGSNPANDLQLLLETLAISFDLEIKQKGDKIYIRNNF